MIRLEEEDEVKKRDKSEYYLAQVAFHVHLLYALVFNLFVMDDKVERIDVGELKITDFLLGFKGSEEMKKEKPKKKVEPIPTPEEYHRRIRESMTDDEQKIARDNADLMAKARWGVRLGIDIR